MAQGDPTANDVVLHVRRHRRFACIAIVRVQTLGFNEVTMLMSQDVSQSGVFVSSERPLRRGASVQITIRLPVIDEEHLVFGRVARRVSPEQAEAEGTSPGMGVAFTDASPAFSQALSTFLAAAEAEDAQPQPTIEGVTQKDDPHPLEGKLPEVELDDWQDEAAATLGPIPEISVPLQSYDEDEEDPEEILRVAHHDPDAQGQDMRFEMRLFTSAQAAFDKGEYQRCIGITADLIENNPNNTRVKVLCNLASGLLLKQQGQGEEALVHFQEAADLDPDCTPAVEELRRAGISKPKKNLRSVLRRFRKGGT